MNKRTILTVALLVLATHGAAATPGAIEDCPPTIMERSRKMAAFDLKCRGGYVAQFCLSDEKQPWPDFEFFAVNVQVFGLKRDDIYEYNKHPHQHWKGVPILPGLGFLSYVRPGSFKTKCMNVSIVDTRNWSLDVKPTVSSATATALALSLWKAQAPKGRFSVDVVNLEISGRDKPRLIWAVGAIWHKKEADHRVTCDVDAKKTNSYSGCSLEPIGETL